MTCHVQSSKQRRQSKPGNPLKPSLERAGFITAQSKPVTLHWHDIRGRWGLMTLSREATVSHITGRRPGMPTHQAPFPVSVPHLRAPAGSIPVTSTPAIAPLRPPASPPPLFWPILPRTPLRTPSYVASAALRHGSR
jgi:hypothetical protein